MNDKYNMYSGQLFEYDYPYTWFKRNKNYLNKVHNRQNIKEFITPVIFRLIFKDVNGSIISDNTYNPNSKQLFFPDNPIIVGKIFIGWGFYRDGEIKIITKSDLNELKSAVEAGIDSFELYPQFVN